MAGSGETPPKAAAGLAVGRRWAFAQAVLDERSLELTVGGAPVRLERKPLEVLLYLLHHAGEVVTKEELADNLWPGRILTESVLTRCISQLRQALKDDDRTLIRTAHGFGYRLVAKVTVDTAASAAPPVFAFKAGDHPPLRPQWRLVERLGTGGHGEAWLARHEKTQEARVFKFALDAGSLNSLKREITLYRLMAESMGEYPPIVQIHEWNLEEPPYFIETEYVAGRDFRAWAESQGGLAGQPLALRLELVAQIADALAAAHAVGVLHKDLKPGNVLVAADANGQPRIKLADFGSGSVLDAARLEGLGITKLGFTRTAAAGSETSGTPLYLAPEVIGGQPFTVAADIYALGVILYQVIVGDLRKALAPGWELNVDDELLREDIALAAAGDPVRRLAEAAQMASRLRSLETRRHARAAEAIARERAERTRKLTEELRRMRAVALAMLVLAVAAIGGGIATYRAHGEADAARAMAESINHFLTDDVLSVNPENERPADASYEFLLKRAASQVQVRFKDHPEAAAHVHWLLARRFLQAGLTEPAMTACEKASALLPRLRGRAALPALLALDRLIPIYQDRGRQEEALTVSKVLSTHWQERYGRNELSTLVLRARVARTLAYMGAVTEADQHFRTILEDGAHATGPSEETRIALMEWLGVVLATDTSRFATNKEWKEATIARLKAAYAGYLAEFAEDYRGAADVNNEVLPVVVRLFGDTSEQAAMVRMALSVALASLGRHDDADEHVSRVEALFVPTLPPEHWAHGVLRLLIGRVEMEKGNLKGAVDALDRAVTLCIERRCPPRVTEDVRYELGRAADLLGDLGRAIEIYRSSLTAYEALRGPSNLGCLRRRVSLADALRRSGERSEATALLSGVTPEALGALPSKHLVIAELRRTQGLLWVEVGRVEDGRNALAESLDIVKHHFGSGHWRFKRARTELESNGAK